MIHYDDLWEWHNSREPRTADRAYKYVTMHLCHNVDCLNPHHLAFGSHAHNKDMLHLPLLPGFQAHEQLPTSSPEYYWLTLESMKELLIGKLGNEGLLRGTGLFSRARQDCLSRAEAIVEAHLQRCKQQSPASVSDTP